MTSRNELRKFLDRLPMGTPINIDPDIQALHHVLHQAFEQNDELPQSYIPAEGQDEWLRFVVDLVNMKPSNITLARKLFDDLMFQASSNLFESWSGEVLRIVGQVYFGHLKSANRDYLVLSDIYYLRVSQQLQPSSQQPQTSINLVKLGDEIHGPEDTMYIPKGQVIFWESMKADSAVVKVISEEKAQKK